MKFGLNAPWFNYFNKVRSIFGADADITMSDIEKTEDGNYEFTISSKNNDKLSAIEKLLGYGKSFGNVSVKIKYGYENAKEEDMLAVWEKAFEGNPLFDKCVAYEVPLYGRVEYALFNKEIISFYDDNISDYTGNSHYIVADAIKDIVNVSNVRPCTV